MRISGPFGRSESGAMMASLWKMFQGCSRSRMANRHRPGSGADSSASMEEAGVARKPSEGVGIDLTVHGGGPQESGGHQERCRGCGILGASDSGGLERVADGDDNRCPEIQSAGHAAENQRRVASCRRGRHPGYPGTVVRQRGANGKRVGRDVNRSGGNRKHGAATGVIPGRSTRKWWG